MPNLVASSPRGKQLSATRPNAGVAAWYRKKLEAEIAAMHRSLLWWLRAHYRQVEPEIAMDRNPATVMRQIMDRLTAKWRSRFDELADDLAKQFVNRSFRQADRSLLDSLKDAGFTVQFRPTMAVKNAITAAVAENVVLIRSIGEQHLADVNGLVMRSVTQGRDLGGLTEALRDRYGITQRRAALIARDQNNKASAIVVRARQSELGITEAIWRHSHAGKHPRPSHVEVDGKRYKVAEGLVLDGERVWPGTAIGCRCYSVPFIPGFDD